MSCFALLVTITMSNQTKPYQVQHELTWILLLADDITFTHVTEHAFNHRCWGPHSNETLDQYYSSGLHKCNQTQCKKCQVQINLNELKCIPAQQYLTSMFIRYYDYFCRNQITKPINSKVLQSVFLYVHSLCSVSNGLLHLENSSYIHHAVITTTTQSNDTWKWSSTVIPTWCSTAMQN